ncbi:MAG: PmoA family protein, partial [Verrucomicrobiota bacterium]
LERRSRLKSRDSEPPASNHTGVNRPSSLDSLAAPRQTGTMLHTVHPLAFALSLLAAAPAFAADKATRVNVSAGGFDRRGVIVSFELPKAAREFRALRGPKGELVPVQVDADGRAFFIEPELKKGAVKSYQLVGAGVDSAGVVAKKDGSVVKLSAGGKAVLQYQMEPSEVPSPDVPAYFRHGAYLHPVFSPAGKIVTGDYPRDHRWHRGIWFAWTHTEFEGRTPDFWNMGKEKDGKLTGAVEFDSLETTWSGPVHGGFRGKHRFVDWMSGQPKPVLNETWSVTVYATGAGAKPVWVFDLVSTQECAASVPLKLPKYHYGGLGVRGSGQWDNPSKVIFLTANGDDRAKGDSTKARWVQFGGDVDGQPAGIAILCHPDNFRAPQPLRLNPKNPQLCWAPSQDGDWEITPGKPYISRYRFIIADATADAADIDRLWNNYANPPQISVE